MASMNRIFLGYSFSMPEIADAVRKAAEGLAEVVVASDEILGSHILEKILRQMRSSDLCLFDLTGHNVNVALELGLAMGANKSYRLLYNPESKANPSGTRDFFSDLKGWDHLRYIAYDDLADRLASALPTFLSDARSGNTMGAFGSAVIPPEADPYETAISDTFSVMARAYVVPTYVCRFYLTVKPRRFSDERLPIDNLPQILDSVIVRSRFGRLPLNSPLNGGMKHVRDGIQVDTDVVGVAKQRHREMYRFYKSGLFVFERVLPSDIEASGDYTSGDRCIGYLELIGTVTQMGVLSAALATVFDEDTVATVRIAGLAHHTLSDDTEHSVLGRTYPSPIEDGLEVSWSGSPSDFAQNGVVWARDLIREVLRLLNAPSIGAAAIETWQSRFI